MRHFEKQKIAHKSLHIETLERRRVFATDLDVLHQPDTLPVDTWRPIDSYILNRLNQFEPNAGEIVSLSSQAELDEKLKALVGKYWEGVLGKQPAAIANFSPYPSWFGHVGYFESAAADTNLSLASTRSITNSRHADIDEADLVDMTNDGYLYTIVGNSVHAVNLRAPSQLSAKTAIALDGHSAQLFVAGNSLIVLQSTNERPLLVEQGVSRFIDYSRSKISVYDIADRMLPRMVTSTLIEGSNIAARLTSGQLTLVQRHQATPPEPALVANAEGLERYESLDSYYATNRDAIRVMLHPLVAQYHANQSQRESIESGTWDDLSFANESLSQLTTVLRFELTDANSLKLADSETITGLNASLVYQGIEDIYLIDSNWWNDTKSTIYKIDATAGGQLKTHDVVEIRGRVIDMTWLNEHDGVLQVASNETIAVGDDRTAIDVEPASILPAPFLRRTFANSANVTTIGETDAGWAVLGTLLDVGDGQSLLAANFIGDRAVLTTGVPELFDPLHGIDLSDPTKPVELSELTIPGFTTYLKQIDGTHWLGFGFEQNPAQRVSYLQVSLYQVVDLANPVVVDRWTSTTPGWGQSWDPHTISYDPATGLVTMVGSQSQVAGLTHSLPLLKVDPSAQDALREVGNVYLPESIVRAFTLDEFIVAVGNHSITTFAMSDLTHPLGSVYLANYDSLSNFYWTVDASGSRNWRLADLWAGEPFVITALETSGDISATLNADQSITLTAAGSSYGVSQTLKLTVQFESGHTHTVTGFLFEPYLSLPSVTARGSLHARFEDDAGNVISELSAGDEVWVTVSGSDSREVASGIFAAYVDVSFESQNITVIGQPEHLGPFVNGKSGNVSESGLTSLGGFGGSTPPGGAISDFVRFKIRVENDEPVTLVIRPPADAFGHEFLVHGASQAVDPANVASFVLTTQPQTMRALVTAENRQQDINSDGVITALDVLQLVNFINARQATSSESRLTFTASVSSGNALDITADGVVSAADVLQIVNTINARYDAPASGEGHQLSAAAVDQLFLVDLDTLAVDAQERTARRLNTATGRR